MSAASRERLHGALACVPSAIAIVDPEGRILEVNPRWSALGDAAPGPGAAWIAAVHPDDRALLAGARADGALRVRVVAGAQERWAAVAVAAGAGGEAVVALTDIDTAHRDEREREALHRVADVVARGHDVDGCFALVAREIAQLVGADGGGVAQFVSETTGRLVGRWTADADLDARAGPELPLTGMGTTAIVFETGRPATVDYVAGGSASPYPWSVAAAAPIRVDGALWGALGVVNVRPEPLLDDVEDRLMRFAQLVGLAISGAEARAELERQARTDPLTGLAHHGTFHAALEDEIARAGRYAHPLSLAMIDIDHFKRVNDDFGHLAGDRALRAVADLLRRHARAIDTVGRVGGEEFAWLMPETATAGARAAAERFRAALSAAPVGEVGALTVSIGIAQPDGATPCGTTLFRAADRALYRAKAEGRDRTVLAWAEAAPEVAGASADGRGA